MGQHRERVGIPCVTHRILTGAPLETHGRTVNPWELYGINPWELHRSSIRDPWASTVSHVYLWEHIIIIP